MSDSGTPGEPAPRHRPGLPLWLWMLMLTAAIALLLMLVGRESFAP